MTSQLQGLSFKLKGQSHVGRHQNKNAWEHYTPKAMKKDKVMSADAKIRIHGKITHQRQ
jgi:hypothetical protein